MYLILMKTLPSQREYKFVFISLLDINSSIIFSYNLSIESILIFVQAMLLSGHLNTFFPIFCLNHHYSCFVSSRIIIKKSNFRF